MPVPLFIPKESDRGLVLVSASFLDERLEELLRDRFSMIRKKEQSIINPLFESIGPLSSFSSKIKLSYALDLIPKWMYQDLNIIRKIRNEFAHTTMPVFFGTCEIVKLTEKLVGANHAVAAMNKNELKQNRKKQKGKIESNQSETNMKANMERMRLTMTVAFIGGLIESKIEFVNSDIPIDLKQKVLNRPQ